MRDQNALRAEKHGPGSLTTTTLLIALIATTATEIVFYPQIASWLHAAATGRGWDGSALRYFQLFRVLPAAIGGIAILTGFALWGASRDRPLGLKAVALAWAVEIAAFVLSIAWYASAAG